MSDDHYTYRVTWSPEDGDRVGLCLEFPSLSWLATTPEKAFDGIRGLVQEVVTDMNANAESLPEPLAGRAGTAPGRSQLVGMVQLAAGEVSRGDGPWRPS